MKWGIRKPSLKRRISARTSWKRYLRHSLGLKAPRGWGWITNPKKALYNRVYRRTTVGVDDLLRPTAGRGRSTQNAAGCLVMLLMATVGIIALRFFESLR